MVDGLWRARMRAERSRRVSGHMISRFCPRSRGPTLGVHADHWSRSRASFAYVSQAMRYEELA
jgi:hypothetical protein